jgi:N,N'-diacetyllegionaminate synthase
LIDSAVEIGVDAVKFQTLDAETVTTKNNYFDMEATGHVSQYDIFKQFELSKELQLEIVKYARDLGLLIFSAPSHMQDLEIIKKMDSEVFKIGSDLACHIPLLKAVAKIGKPIILSTGMCTLDEVEESVNAILSTGNDQIILMHCVSNYPSKIEEVNLNAIQSMKEKFNIPVGLSDHCIGSLIVLGSVMMGANVIEKHFKDEKNSPSPDNIHSLDRNEFSQLIKSIRILEKAKGDGIKKPTDMEMKNIKTNRVSIVSMQDIEKGNVITKEMIDIRRPGTGIQPIHLEKVIGSKSKVNVSKETPITFDMIE